MKKEPYNRFVEQGDGPLQFDLSGVEGEPFDIAGYLSAQDGAEGDADLPGD